ncbi:MAG: hypothetical protein IJ583_15165 [Firmicutes bacterium]|nr:hypothetical protein [Bacillota bacterium]
MEVKMDLKFIDDNFIGNQKEKEVFKIKFCKAVRSGDFDSIRPQLYDFLAEYKKRNPHREEKKQLWYEAISDKVKRQNQYIVDECVEFAKNEKIDVDFFYNGLRCGVRKGEEITTEDYQKNPFGNPYIGVKAKCDPERAYEFDMIIGKYGGYVEVWDYFSYYFADCHGADAADFKKFDEATENITQKYIYPGLNDVPPILSFIQNIWSQRCKYTGDGGSCVIGEGMEFTYNGQIYTKTVKTA